MCTFPRTPTISFVFTLLLIWPSIAPAQLQKGDSVQFQWGPHQVQGTVRAAFGDQLIVRFQADGSQAEGKQTDGKPISTTIRVENARPFDRGAQAQLQPPRLKLGDYVQDFLDPSFTGKVTKLDGADAEVEATVDGQTHLRTATIDSLIKLDGPPRGPATAPLGASSEMRHWVDTTGEHKIEAALVAVRQDKVILLRADNHKQVALPITKLSTTDQDYVAARDVRYVDFTPPADMTPVSTCVSLHETAAVLGYSPGHQPPLEKLVVLNLDSKNRFRVVDVPSLDEGICRAVSDDGRYVLIHHQEVDSSDPETKQRKVSWYLTVWNCAEATAKPLRKFRAMPSSMYVQHATWIDQDHLFSGRSDGKVYLWKIEGEQVNTVYTKTLGHSDMMRVFAMSPHGKLFAVENSRKDQIEVYTTHDAELIRKVPAKVSSIETIALTNTMLLGTTSTGESVTWDLKKNELAGQGRAETGVRLLHSGSASLLPLSDQHALHIRHHFRVAQECSVYDFAEAQSYPVTAPPVLTAGQGRRIWYPTDDGMGHHRYRSFTIPQQLQDSTAGPLKVPGYPN